MRVVCKKCAFFFEMREGRGHCYRHPPVILSSGGMAYSERPEVHTDDFCGDGHLEVLESGNCESGE